MSKAASKIIQSFSPTLLFLTEKVFGRNFGVSEADIDKEKLIDLIRCHRLISLSSHRLGVSDIQLKESIDQVYYFNKIEQLRSLTELIRIDLLFKEEDIRIMPLKGHLLSQLVYDDPTERTSRDIDILVQAKDVIKCVEMLCANGYELKTLFDTTKQRAAIVKHYYNLELKNESEGYTIEIHWRISSSRTYRFDLQKIWEQSEEIKVGESVFQLMRKDDLLAYLSLHGQMHSYFRLHWLADIYFLLDKLTDEERAYIISELIKSDVSLYFLATMNLLSLLTDIELSQEVIEAIKTKQKRVDKLCHIALREIRDNIYLTNRPNDFRFRLKRMLRYHRMQYLTGGFKALLRSIVGRNVRPQNWKLFVFPDSVFFLNHLFSRFIWLFGKISGRI